jgi:hypothetical protein
VSGHCRRRLDVRVHPRQNGAVSERGANDDG